MGIEIHKYGAFFETDTAAEAKAACDLIEEHVAKTALDVWQGLLTASIRVNTGAYQSGNKAEKREGHWVVHDDIDKPYGPWLEGVGSRNSPVTRFPGYFALHRAYIAVDDQAGELAKPVIEELVSTLNAGPG